jgi:hypothetical protein
MKIKFFIIALLIVLISPIVQAKITFVAWEAPPEVSIRVGARTGVTTVIHDVPASQVGDGTPITGTPDDVLIEASARPTSFIITVDSSSPLSNGTHTIPFTDISWTAKKGDIPSGRFNGMSTQVILQPSPGMQKVKDWLTFIYDNTRVVPYGTYTGSVTYTVSVP